MDEIKDADDDNDDDKILFIGSKREKLLALLGSHSILF